MTNYKKIISIIICIVFIASLTLKIGITKYLNHKEIEKQKIIEQFKPSMEIFLKTYYNNINSVTVDQVEKKPLGTELIGYVNGDKELRIFSFIDFIEENGVLKPVITDVDVNVKLNDWEKEEYKDNFPYTAYELLEQQQAKEKKEK